MMRKKSTFWNFCFSLIPGAGEMYQGFYKQGVSLMVGFWGIIAGAAFLNLDVLFCTLPIIWFYSFFHTHNLAAMPDEEFYALEDGFLFGIEDDKVHTVFSGQRGKKILAGILIALGLGILLDNFQSATYNILYTYHPRIASIVDGFLYKLPQVVVAFLMVLLGIHMVRGKKKELDLLEEKNDGKQ